jgi:hypothetical protein
LTPTTDPPPDLPARIVALGREGFGAVEIAAALGFGVRELERMARGDPAVELVLDRAEAAALAWWARAPRRAMAAGARFPWAAWRRGVGWLSDEGGRASRARSAAARPPPAPRARYEIPCNRTSRARPDGTCPQCGERHWDGDEDDEDDEIDDDEIDEGED